MACDVSNAAEMSAVVNDLIGDIEELKEALKAQREHMGKLEEGQMELYKKVEGCEETMKSGIQQEQIIGKDNDASSIEVVLKQGLLEINEAVKKQPTEVYQTRNYIVFGDRMGTDHFKVVVNTVMKWALILIAALSFIAIVKFLVHYQ